MNTPTFGEVVSLKPKKIGDDLLDKYYVEMAELIDKLVFELSDYTPIYYDSFQLLHLTATKIFQKFIGEVHNLVEQAKELDENMIVQGKLFEDNE